MTLRDRAEGSHASTTMLAIYLTSGCSNSCSACGAQAELQAKQAARAARLITSGDGFVTHMETSRSTSGELPPHLGPPGGPGQPNSLEFLPVLPPMHVHSHPVTTGQGPTVRHPRSHTSSHMFDVCSSELVQGGFGGASCWQVRGLCRSSRVVCTAPDA